MGLLICPEIRDVLRPDLRDSRDLVTLFFAPISISEFGKNIWQFSMAFVNGSTLICHNWKFCRYALWKYHIIMFSRIKCICTNTMVSIMPWYFVMQSICINWFLLPILRSSKKYVWKICIHVKFYELSSMEIRKFQILLSVTLIFISPYTMYNN